MKALIVGGEPNFIKNVLTKRLLGYDIEVFSVWDWDHSKPITKIPTECDCVIVVKDMTGHTQRNVARQLAKRQGLMFIEIPRKWAVIKEHFKVLGLIPNSEKSDDVLHVQGEDFAVVFARVVECSYGMYKQSGVRPSAAEVSAQLDIPTWHLAMQKGIATGVAKANGEMFNPGEVNDGWTIEGMVEIALNDYPEMIRDKANLCHFMADLLGKKNSKNFQKKVKGIAVRLRKRWVRSSRKAETHPDRRYIDGLKIKWFEDFARNHHNENSKFPAFSNANIRARQVFDSQLTRKLYNLVIETLEAELNPELKQVMEQVEEQVEQVIEKTIPEVVPPKQKPERKQVVKSKSLREAISKHFELLGKVHDSVVAEKVGCSTTTIRRYRLEKGIPKYAAPKPPTQPQTRVEEVPLEAFSGFPNPPIEDAEPVLALNEFNNTKEVGLSDALNLLRQDNALILESLKELIVKNLDMEQRLVLKEKRIDELEKRLGMINELPDTLGSKVDGLLASGFKVKLEVTTE
tara:strand:+ start:6367 stop:7917 length:1551 start_codon:yes stop_codon:yes gene_type:complete